MATRYFLSLIVLLSFTLSSEAQKVQRKGVTPLQKKSTKKAKKPICTVEQLRGKWQEMSRKDYKKNPVAFTDSIQLYFKEENKVETRISIDNKMSMKGGAVIDEDNNLTVAADDYIIKSLSNKELVLDDGDQYLHYLQKVDSFWYESLGKTQVTQDVFTTPVTVAVADILGKWSVYRRQAKPGYITESITLIKYLNITENVDSVNAKGEITVYKGQSSQQLSCNITLLGTNLHIVAGDLVFNLPIYKADKKELVFGSADEVLYYCKPL